MDALHEPGAAARQVAAGRPGALARPWLAGIAALAASLFTIDTALVVANRVLPFDVPVEQTVQETPLGPLTYAMDLTNWIGGYRQVILGVIVVLAFAAYDRRAGWLMAIGAIASPIDNLIKVAVARNRPTASLVDVLSPNAGFSFPSGHAVFYTWLAFMSAAALAPRLAPRWRPGLWGLALALALVASLGRIWAGAHWPSDVLGGFLLGLGWSAFVLWLPERWLPTPSRTWWRRGRRAPAQA